MNFMASECSGGCESGWTLYLEQSLLSPTNRGTKFVDAGVCDNGKYVQEENEKEDEEEDLSMVSDASSGPPHFNEDEGYFNYDTGCFYPSFKDTTLVNNGGKRQHIMKEHRRKKDQELPSFLDDTASSPAYNFPKNNFAVANNHQASIGSTVLDYSQGFSATYFEGRSAYQDHIANYMQPSLSAGNQLQNNQLKLVIREEDEYKIC